jgi:hypothetical protein
MRSFDQFACIDWSGAKGRLQKGIEIAHCYAGDSAPLLIPPPERYWSRQAILAWLRQQALESHNILIGLDLSLGFPFEDAGAYFPGWAPSPPHAKALWQLVDDIAHHDDHLGVDSFVCHPEISRHFRRHNQCGDLFGAGRGRLRKCEYDGQALIDGINPYSCFNLVGAAQVGKSSLTGMRVLHQLAGVIAVWPFDPIPKDGPVIVEIYTSLAVRSSNVMPKGRTKITDADTLDAVIQRFGSRPHQRLGRSFTEHATDAIATAAWMRSKANESGYWQPQAMKTHHAQTEGWTFGVI